LEVGQSPIDVGVDDPVVGRQLRKARWRAPSAESTR
jgi:hypothetical protein